MPKYRQSPPQKLSKILQDGRGRTGEIDFQPEQSSQGASKTNSELNMTPKMIQKSSHKASKMHPKWLQNARYDMIIMTLQLWHYDEVMILFTELSPISGLRPSQELLLGLDVLTFSGR